MEHPVLIFQAAPSCPVSNLTQVLKQVCEKMVSSFCRGFLPKRCEIRDFQEGHFKAASIGGIGGGVAGDKLASYIADITYLEDS